MVSDQHNTLPTFSVIVPAYNEERLIHKCLASLISQNYPRELFDIIVVDNGSTDNTVAVCKENKVTVLSHPGIRVGAMRNRGADAATGDILAFLDADCVADPEWLSNAARVLAEQRCITGGPHELPEHPHWIERAWYAQEHRGRRRAQLIPSGNMIAPRDTYMQLGGFDETLIAGEDAEFSLRAAHLLPVIADSRIRAIHLGNPRSLSRFLARETWHGMGALGSFSLDWKDKPLFGTILFALLTIGQAVGIVLLVAGAGSEALLFSTLGLVLLLSATVGYRLFAVGDWSVVPALFLLYYCYYLGRSRSFLKLLARREFRRGER